MTQLKEGLIGGGLNLYFIYKFLRILTTPWEKSEAFKLGIVDDNGKILKKKRTLKTVEEKEAYTIMHRLVWKLKRLMEKVPFGKSRLASYAAALWLIKEHKFQGTDEQLQESFLSFLETDWKNDALILKENHEGDMDKKTFYRFKEEYTIKEEVELDEAEGYEVFMLGQLKRKGIDARFWKGNLYVSKREIKTAKEILKRDPNIDKIPSIIGEETELDEKWAVGVVYHQEFSNGDRAYFRADSAQKNKRWKGMQVDEFGGKQKKAKNATADEKVQGWETTPKNEIPKALKEEVEEAKSHTGYELYHKTFSGAMQHAYDHAKKKGHIVDPKEIDDKVAVGPKKPSSGKTNRYELKAGRKTVFIQVANLDNKRYELNMYIEEVELGEATQKVKGGHLGNLLKSVPAGRKYKFPNGDVYTSIGNGKFEDPDGKTINWIGLGAMASSKFKNDTIVIESVEEGWGTSKPFAGWIAIYKGQRLEIKKSEAKGLWPAKQLALKHFKVPKSKEGLLAIAPAIDEMNEALKSKDKSVIDAFYRKDSLEGKLLSTDGKSLEKLGMGGQTIASWVKNKIAVTAVSDVKSTDTILNYMKKTIPKLNFDKESYKDFFEEVELDEIRRKWKKGNYTVTDQDDKVLGTFKSGAKAQKFVDKIWDEGDYDSLTVKMGEEVVEGKSFDTHQKKIAIDTVKNPNKSLLGGPSPEEAEKILKTKFKYTDKMIAKLKEEVAEGKSAPLIPYVSMDKGLWLAAQRGRIRFDERFREYEQNAGKEWPKVWSKLQKNYGVGNQMAKEESALYRILKGMKKWEHPTNEDVEIDERDEWKNTRIQAKNIFKMLKQNHKNDIPKMKSGLELILKQNKTKPDQEKIMWQEFNKYFKIKEEVEIEEDYEGPPYEEGTKEYLDYCMDLTPGEKVGEARTGDAEDEFQKAMDKFIKKGGKIKKLRDTKSFKSLFKQKGPKKLPRQAEETEKVDITEGRPPIPDLDAARPDDKEKELRLRAQKKIYKPEEIKNIARKHRVKIDGEPKVGSSRLKGDWDIDIRGGIRLDYDYKNNEMIIKGWKADKKKIRAHINKYEQGGSTYEDLVWKGKVTVTGFEAAFDLIGEEFQLTEAKEFWAVIDKAKGGEVMAVSSDEKGAKSSVKMSTFSKYDYHYGKDPKTLKIVKVAGSYKKGEKMIGTKLSFKEAAPANKTGVNVVGTGDDPTVWKRKKKKKVKTEEFGGNKVFVVSGQRFHDSRLGKARYARYEKYVGNDDVGEAIRLYGRTNPKLPIILKNSESGAMLYLKYGNKR